MNNKVKKRKHRSWKAWAVVNKDGPVRMINPDGYLGIAEDQDKALISCAMAKALTGGTYKLRAIPVIITEVRPLNNKVEG